MYPPHPNPPLNLSSSRPTDVLNGIAYVPADQSFLLTGKLWGSYYRVRISEIAEETKRRGI